MAPAPGRWLGAALVLLLVASPASAGGRITTRASAPASPTLADSLDAHHLPVPEVAQRMSARSTAMPFAIGTAAFAIDAGLVGSGYIALAGYLVATAGIVVGPVSGYSYGGIPGRGSLGVGLRLALAVGVPVGVALYMPDDWNDEDEIGAIALGVLAGAGLAAVSAVWDISTVAGDVERNNSRLLQGAHLRIEPALTPFAHAPGVAVRLGLGGS